MPDRDDDCTPPQNEGEPQDEEQGPTRDDEQQDDDELAEESWQDKLRRATNNLLQRIRANKILSAAIAAIVVLVVVIAVLVWPRTPGLLEDDSVIVGTGTDEPRVAYQDPLTNKRSGFDVDFYRWLADANEPKFVPSENDVNIGTREQALRSGQVELVFDSYSITTVRDRQIDFAGPYMFDQQGVMLRSAEVQSFSLGDLQGQKVCAQSGATSISGIDGIPDAIGVPRSTLIECMNGLKSGEFKAVSTDQLLLRGWVIEFPNDPLAVVEGTTFGAIQEWGIGLPHGPGTRNCEDMTQWIRTFLDSGQWDIFFRENFPGIDPAPHKPESKMLRECRDDPDE